MYWMHMNFFWIFVMVVVLAGTVSRIIRSHQREKTIRAAIEKGVTLDPATLHSLQARDPSDPGNARAGLFTGAIVTFFVGCGLGVMGFILSDGGNVHAFRGLLGVSGLLWCIALGLLIAGFAARRA